LKTKYLIYGNIKEGNLAYELFCILKLNSELEVITFNRESFFSPLKIKIFDRTLILLFNHFLRFFLNISLFYNWFFFKPDIFFSIKGLDIYPIILHYISKKSKTINWNLDHFLNFNNSNKQLLNSIKNYHIIFSPKKEVFNKYEKLGAKQIVFIENFYQKKHHFFQDIKKKYQISFVGSWSKKREKYLMILSSKFLINVFGNSWKRKVKMPNIICKENIDQFEYNYVINSSIINLNFFTVENNDTSNLRLFEVAACKGLLLSEFSERASNFLIPDTDAFYFNNEMEILNKVETILNLKQNKIDEICNNGFEKIKKYNLEYRVEKILKKINK